MVCEKLHPWTADKKKTIYYLKLTKIHGFSIRQLFEDFCWATQIANQSYHIKDHIDNIFM